MAKKGCNDESVTKQLVHVVMNNACSRLRPFRDSRLPFISLVKFEFSSALDPHFTTKPSISSLPSPFHPNNIESLRDIERFWCISSISSRFSKILRKSSLFIIFFTSIPPLELWELVHFEVQPSTSIIYTSIMWILFNGSGSNSINVVFLTIMCALDLYLRFGVLFFTKPRVYMHSLDLGVD